MRDEYDFSNARRNPYVQTNLLVRRVSQRRIFLLEPKPKKQVKFWI